MARVRSAALENVAVRLRPYSETVSMRMPAAQSAADPKECCRRRQMVHGARQSRSGPCARAAASFKCSLGCRQSARCS
eukprot:scaffold5586_cov124-Isochrysis_galbana.AAC.13